MTQIPHDDPCERTRRYLDSYLDNELLVETNLEVLRHLENCRECAAESESRAAVKLRLRTAVRAQAAPPDLPARVRDGLRQRPATRFSRPGWPVPNWGVAVAAALILMTAGVWVWKPGPGLPSIDDRAAQNLYIRRISASLPAALQGGLKDHVHCAVFRKYPENPPSVSAMLEELGPYGELLPAVAAVIPKDWQVVMAHQCNYLGRHYVHVTMRNGSRLVSLVIARKEGGESLAGMQPVETVQGIPMYEGAAGNYTIAGFESSGYLGFVVSDEGKSTTLSVASSMATPVCRILSQIL